MGNYSCVQVFVSNVFSCDNSGFEVLSHQQAILHKSWHPTQSYLTDTELTSYCANRNIGRRADSHKEYKF